MSTLDEKKLSETQQCAELDAYLTALRAEYGLGAVLVGLAYAIGDAMRSRMTVHELSPEAADELQKLLERTVFGDKTSMYQPRFSHLSQ